MNPIIQLSQKLWVRAAVILIAILSGAFLHGLIPRFYTEENYNEVIVPYGQMSQINLPDGSKIWLNSGTVFKYPTSFNQTEREVFINGEAFFEIAKNKSKPFTVMTDDFSVSVVGTSFNLTAYSDDNLANVTLVEGKIKLKSKDHDRVKNMDPGQSAILNSGELQEINKVNTEFYTSWKEGTIVFRKETLEQIAKKMERWYNVEIYFTDESVKDLVFSGAFLKYKPVDQVLKSLSIMDNRIDFQSKNRLNKKNIIYVTKKE